ncbi:FMN-binding protein [Sphingomicrobium nitratireducens]|uniref:FMN-binding protein n=1 Tax=Sphingomicrobium nitratireducens TaxID=2964666 RepID=UPI00223F459A|nr:FMN-binding protein [Sphingomicrobium nitratireducens]
MTQAGHWFVAVPVAVIAATAPAPAHAERYLSVAEAQKHFFPSARQFVERPLDLSEAQRKAIGKIAGTKPPKRQPLFEARGSGGRQGWMFVDRVLGKHEYITYAVALSPEGQVRGVEILDYRETYGGEIRRPDWRKQFVGRRPGQSLKLGKEIKNISGATLSSRHVTDGVRRLLVTFDKLVARD